MQQVTTVFGWRQKLSFIDDQPTWGTRAQPSNIRYDSRQLGMKMGPMVNPPALATRTPVTEIAPFENVVQAYPGVAIVVVVGLPDVPKESTASS
jgi:hypothetical protein